MSKPSSRKLKKQKDRERRVGQRKLLVAERKLYAASFPSFVFLTNNAPAGFVDLIHRTIRRMDFRDTSLFCSKERDFLKLIKRSPENVTTALMDKAASGNLAGIHYSTMVGRRVFSQIPLGELHQWIPYNDVQFLMAGEKIVVIFRSLESSKGPGGTIYFSRHKPTLEIDGQQKIVGWSRHAIERTCQRLGPRWDSYLGLGEVFALFDQCLHYDLVALHDGKPAFSFFDSCADGFFSGRFAEEVLGKRATESCYYRVGYCPLVIEGDFAKATSLLYPGFSGTPEFGLILRSAMPPEEKRKLIKQVTAMSREQLEITGDFSMIRWFHEQGIQQVIETPDKMYAAPL